MALAVDSDAYCKLAAARLFEESVRLLGEDPCSCYRLPALPHMLRRSRLRKNLGDELADALVEHAESLPEIPEASDEWLDPLVGIDSIDPGEAQILAVAGEQGFVVVSGDKRALKAVASVPGFAEALSGRIVVLEALLLALCKTLGVDEVRSRVVPLMRLDKTVSICFSNPDGDPRVGLDSYLRDLVREVAPLVLWDPR